MSHKQRIAPVVFDELDCFGDYSRANPLCANHCALRLRCAIEQEQNIRMELLSDLATAGGMAITYQ
ncbi:MAG: hypothetical protein C4519_20500 [Desulfobacteraceae bacterium]|nr:MAG: hypothetical protein C4519_20500 [Desulfobacteraceae bacterium]